MVWYKASCSILPPWGWALINHGLQTVSSPSMRKSRWENDGARQRDSEKCKHAGKNERWNLKYACSLREWNAETWAHKFVPFHSRCLPLDEECTLSTQNSPLTCQLQTHTFQVLPTARADEMVGWSRGGFVLLSCNWEVPLLSLSCAIEGCVYVVIRARPCPQMPECVILWPPHFLLSVWCQQLCLNIFSLVTFNRGSWASDLHGLTLGKS